MNKILVILLLLSTTLVLGCIDTPRSYDNLGISFDVVSVTRIHQNNNIKYSVTYIDSDCNCNKEISSGQHTLKDGRTAFINIVEKNSNVSRLTIDTVQGNNNIISSTLIIEVNDKTNITDIDSRSAMQ